MRPLWVEYPSEVPTFTLDDEYLLGELQVFGIKFTSFFSVVLFNDLWNLLLMKCQIRLVKMITIN